MTKYVDKVKLLDWLHDKWNQFGANNDLFEQEAIEQVTIEVKRGAFDADESEGTWKATSEFAFRLNDQLEVEVQRLRAALEEIRDHAIRFGLATVHMKAEKALSTTTEPTCKCEGTGGYNIKFGQLGEETFPCEVCSADFFKKNRGGTVRPFQQRLIELTIEENKRIYKDGINAPEGDGNNA